MPRDAKSASDVPVRLPPHEVARVQRLTRLTNQTWLSRIIVVCVWFTAAASLGLVTAWWFHYTQVTGVIALCGAYMGILAPAATIWVRQLNAAYSARRLALYPGAGEDADRLPPLFRDVLVETRLARSSIEGLDDGALAVRSAWQYLEYLEGLPDADRDTLAGAGVSPRAIREVLFRGDGEAGVRGELSMSQQHELVLHLERFEHAIWNGGRPRPYR